MPCPSSDSKFVFCILKFLKHAQFFMYTQYGNTACGVFKRGGSELERFFPKNQHTQRKLLNFGKWINGGLRTFKKSEF